MLSKEIRYPSSRIHLYSQIWRFQLFLFEESEITKITASRLNFQMLHYGCALQQRPSTWDIFFIV